jgi:hypothetical protein
MPLVKFISPTDPRWLSTLDEISQELVADSLVSRYNPQASPDGLRGEEGTFSMCTFWYVEGLARAGRVDEARLVFEKMLTYANHTSASTPSRSARAASSWATSPRPYPPGTDQRRHKPRPPARLTETLRSARRASGVDRHQRVL